MNDYLGFAGGVFFVAVLIGAFAFGVNTTAETIANRCEKAGNFLVGDKYYECKVKP